MMKTAAVLTIGQAPRPDVVRDLRRFLTAECRLTEYGVLDGLTRAEAERQFGWQGGELLVSRMVGEPDMIRLSGEKIHRGMQDCIERAERGGADVMVLACTGEFPAYRHRVPLLVPGEEMRRALLAEAQGRRIGVLVPDAGQLSQVGEWWHLCGAEQLLFEAAAPSDPPERVAQAALRLRERGAELLCLDCFSYTAEGWEAAQAATGLRAMLPRAFLAGRVSELLK